MILDPWSMVTEECRVSNCRLINFGKESLNVRHLVQRSMVKRWCGVLNSGLVNFAEESRTWDSLYTWHWFCACRVLDENSNGKLFQSLRRQTEAHFSVSSKLARVPKLARSLVKKFFEIACIKIECNASHNL